MTFDQYWAALMKKKGHPASDAKIVMTVEAFKKSQKQAFEMGGAQTRDIHNKVKDIFGGHDNPFSKMFG